MKDQGPDLPPLPDPNDHWRARYRDPEPSHTHLEGQKVLALREQAFNNICRIACSALPPLILDPLELDYFQLNPLEITEVPVLTRHIERRVSAQLEAFNDGQLWTVWADEIKKESERRGVSDLMRREWIKGDWSPRVGFGLLQKVYIRNKKGKLVQDTRLGAGVIKLTRLGWIWLAHPELRDWRWPPDPFPVD